MTDTPGWARRPDVAGHVVTCVTCGAAMSWDRYLAHGPTCTDERDIEDAPRRQKAAGAWRTRPGCARSAS